MIEDASSMCLFPILSFSSLLTVFHTKKKKRANFPFQKTQKVKTTLQIAFTPRPKFLNTLKLYYCLLCGTTGKRLLRPHFRDEEINGHTETAQVGLQHTGKQRSAFPLPGSWLTASIQGSTSPLQGCTLNVFYSFFQSFWWKMHPEFLKDEDIEERALTRSRELEFRSSFTVCYFHDLGKAILIFLCLHFLQYKMGIIFIPTT